MMSAETQQDLVNVHVVRLELFLKKIGFKIEMRLISSRNIAINPWVCISLNWMISEMIGDPLIIFFVQAA